MAGTPSNQSAPSGNDQNPPPQNDIMSTLAALAGAGLNVAGAVTHAGPAGNQPLGWSEQRQSELQSNYDKGQKQDQQMAQQQLQQQSDAAQIATFTPMLSQLHPDQATIAKSYMTANDLKGTQSYIEKAMSDNRADQRLAKTLAAGAGSDDLKDLNSSISATKDTISQMAKNIDPDVKNAMQLQSLLQNQDLSNGPPDVSKLGLVDKQIAGKKVDELQQLANDSYAAAGGPNEAQRVLQKLGVIKPTQVDPKDVYQDFASKLVGKEPVADHINTAKQVQHYQGTLKMLNYVKANRTSTDPRVQQAVQGARNAIASSAVTN